MWVGDITHRSTICFCIFLWNSLISWRAKMLDDVSKSNSEAMYSAMYTTTYEIVGSAVYWKTWVFNSLGLYFYSLTSIKILNNHVFHDHAKHIEMNCHFVLRHYFA